MFTTDTLCNANTTHVQSHTKHGKEGTATHSATCAHTRPGPAHTPHARHKHTETHTRHTYISSHTKEGTTTQCHVCVPTQPTQDLALATPLTRIANTERGYSTPPELIVEYR